jgi:sulfur-carrier protein
MPTINIKFYANLRTKAGTDGFASDVSNVKDVVSAIEKRFGPNIMKAVNSCSIFVNADNVAQKKGLGTKLHEGDIVHIFPPLGGG